MPSAFIHGGTGQIGRAIASRLLAEGWQVTLASRSGVGAEGFAHKTIAPDDPSSLARALRDGCDLLVDCIAFTKADATNLLALQPNIGRIVAISSASVYTDSQGRTLDTAQTRGFPLYPVPITEIHPTIPPGPQTYSTNKAAMEQTLLQNADVPVAILRPCAIHGPHSKHAREWYFVKRMRDQRPRIPLVDRGENRFQTTSTAAIAEATLHAITLPSHGIFNVADADAPSVLQIGQTIAAHLGSTSELVPINTEHPTLGRTPWSLKSPIICASEFPSQTTYAASIGPAIDWLQTISTTGWETHLSQLAAYPRDHFDYQTEDSITF